MCRLRVGLGPSAKEGPPGEVHLELEVISDHASSARVLTDHRVSGDTNLANASEDTQQLKVSDSELRPLVSSRESLGDKAVI